MEHRKLTGIDSTELRSRFRAPVRSSQERASASRAPQMIEQVQPAAAPAPRPAAEFVAPMAAVPQLTPGRQDYYQYTPEPTYDVPEAVLSVPEQVLQAEQVVELEPETDYASVAAPEPGPDPETHQEVNMVEQPTQAVPMASEEYTDEPKAKHHLLAKFSRRNSEDEDAKHTHLPRSVFIKTHYTINGRPRPWRDRMRQAMLPAMAALLFLMGLGVSTSAVITNHHVAQQVHAETSTSDGISSDGADKPDETQPDKNSISSYSVAADMPRFVRISNLSVFARIRRMSVDAHNAVKAPGNIYDVGWYDNSSRPGEAGGAVFLDGHISGPTKHGVFYDIKKLQKGDKVEVEMGNGSKYTYSVVGQEVFDADKVDMSKALVSKVPGKQGLNMMSCFGKFDSKKGVYTQRIMVYAVRDK